jgi:hypothetical protein
MGRARIEFFMFFSDLAEMGRPGGGSQGGGSGQMLGNAAIPVRLLSAGGQGAD